MDDFEAFRKKKLAAKRAVKRNDPEVDKRLGWVDGMGPIGPKNPKIKGFILGRYSRKKVDPSTLERPAGYESTSRVDPDAERPDLPADRDGPEVKGFRKF